MLAWPRRLALAREQNIIANLHCKLHLVSPICTPKHRAAALRSSSLGRWGASCAPPAHVQLLGMLVLGMLVLS